MIIGNKQTTAYIAKRIIKVRMEMDMPQISPMSMSSNMTEANVTIHDSWSEWNKMVVNVIANTDVTYSVQFRYAPERLEIGDLHEHAFESDQNNAGQSALGRTHKLGYQHVTVVHSSGKPWANGKDRERGTATRSV